jgi:DNA-binding transcriptional ArsR family regulator
MVKCDYENHFRSKRLEIYSTERLTKTLVFGIFNCMVEQNNPDLDLVFHALSDGTRRTLLNTIAQSRLSVGELAAPYAMSLAAVSKHLDVLERAALIRRERQGKSRMVSLNPRSLEAAQDWLTFYNQYWSDGLDRLQAALESVAPEKEP